jgi:multicomponent Na+:H+ antiporter subunit D
MISARWWAEIDPLVPLPVVVPLLVGALIAAFSWLLPRRVVDTVSIATSVGVAAMCAVLLSRASGGHIVYWFGGWHPKHGLAIGISFTVDAIGAGAALLVAVLVSAAMLFSAAYFRDTFEHRHSILLLVFLAALVGFALTGDLFDMFVFFELMSVAAYALTGSKIREPGPLQGALNFGVINSLGSFSLLIGIALVYARTGALNLAQIGDALAGRPADGLVVVAFSMLLIGLFVKAGVVPFHFWLADAYAVVPIPVGVLFAGVFGELGLYGVARVYWTSFDGALGAHRPGLRAVLMGFGVVTAVVGAAMCFLQQHLKRLLAFSTVSHIGLFLVGIALFTHAALAGVAVYVAGHAMAKGALFLLCGVIVYRLGKVDEDALLGQGRALGVTGVLFAVGGVALAETPPFATFTGKALIEDAGMKLGYWWMPLLFAATSAVVGGAVLRVAGRVFVGWGPDEPDRFGADLVGEEETTEDEEEHPPHRQTPALLLVPVVALLAGALALGLVPGLSGNAERSAAAFQDREAYADAVLRGRAHAEPHVEAESASTSSIVYGVASGIGAFALAGLALFRRRLFPAGFRRAVAGTVGPAVIRFRALQSGHLGDYTAWFVLGAAVIGGLLAAVTR